MSIGEKGERYEVEYCRFFNFPCCVSEIASLPAIAPSTRSRLRGTWLSSRPSQTSPILLLTPHSLLSLSFLGIIHEEHYIWKLNFSWPHVSCMSGYPARGSRAVFVSYKDRHGEIQKFALRFASSRDVESFMATLKQLLQSPTESRSKSNDKIVSEISSHSEEVAYRPIEDWSTAITAYQSIDQLESSFDSEVAQNLYFPQTNPISPQTSLLNHDAQYPITSQTSVLNHVPHIPISPQTTTLHNHNVGNTMASFPPSFTSLMSMSSQPNVLGGAMPSLSEQADLKLQLMRYLDASSFQDIMGKVEEVMSEIGNDLFM